MILKRLFYALLIVICAWAGYYLLQQHWKSNEQVSLNTEQPMFVGSHVSNTAFNTAGVRSYQIDATRLEHFSKTGNTDFTKPILWVYQNGTQAEWRVIADNAQLTKAHILTLSGHVKAFNLEPNSLLKNITTDNLQLNLITKEFNTQAQVIINGENFQNIGTGMTGNMDKGTATLLNSVKGRYEAIQN